VGIGIGIGAGIGTGIGPSKDEYTDSIGPI